MCMQIIYTCKYIHIIYITPEDPNFTASQRASRSLGFARMVKQEKQPGAGVVGLATRMELPLKGLVMVASGLGLRQLE